MNEHARRRGHTAAVVARVEQRRTIAGSLNTVAVVPIVARFDGCAHADTRGAGSGYGNGVGIGRGGHVLRRGKEIERTISTVVKYNCEAQL